MIAKTKYVLISRSRGPAAFLCAIILSVLISAAIAGERNTDVITIDDLVSIRDIRAIALSPDGAYAAYQLVQADKDENDFKVSWHVAETDVGGEAIKIADGGESGGFSYSSGLTIGGVAPSEFVWPADGKWVFFTKRRNGETQLWRSRRDRYGQRQVTHSAADVVRPRLSEDGAAVLFSVGRSRAFIEVQNEADARLGYLVEEPPSYSVEHGPFWPLCTADDRERWALEATDRRACRWTVQAYDLDSGREREATHAERAFYFAKEDASPLGRLRAGRPKDQTRMMERPSPDGQSLAWFENIDPSAFRGFAPPVRLAATIGEQEFSCEHDACVTTAPKGLWWRPDRGEVVFLVRGGPRNTLHAFYGWTPRSSDVRLILQSDDVFSDCAAAGDRLICGYETWTTPRRIVSIDMVTGEMGVIADANPAFQDFRFTRIEKVFAEDQFGNLAHAHLVYPQGYETGRRFPLVIVQYRSNGFLRGGTGDEHPIHVLAQNGFAVLSFDTPDREKDRRENDDRSGGQASYLRYVMIDHGPAVALEKMIDELVSRGVVDPERIGITGLSHGATTLDTALLRRNYAAASSAYSVMAPPNFDHSSSSFWGWSMDEAFGGTPFSEEGFAKRAENSVGVNAERIDTPYLIQVADREYHITRQNYHALKDAGKPVEMWIYPDEHHVKWQPTHQYNVYRRNLQWFKYWLQDKEVDDPVDPGQYERWQKMREQHQKNLKNAASRN